MVLMKNCFVLALLTAAVQGRDPSLPELAKSIDFGEKEFSLDVTMMDEATAETA